MTQMVDAKAAEAQGADAAFSESKTEDTAGQVAAPPPAQEGKVRRREVNAINRAERIVNESPYGRLQKFVTENGLEQFRVVLTRRQADGITFALLKPYSLTPEQVETMPEWVGTEFGGGYFKASITNPSDPQERVIDYEFSIEGAAIEPRRTPAQQPTTTHGQYQQFVQPGMPPAGMQVGIAGYPQPGMMYPQQAMGYGRPYGGYQPPPASNPELEALKKTVTALEQQLQGEKAKSELQAMRDGFDRQLAAMQAANDKQLAALMAKLEDGGGRRRDDDSGHMKDMFSMFMEQSKMQQQSLTMMLTKQSDDKRDQLDNMRKQMESDLQFRKDMFAQMEASKDPSKTAAILDMMGHQTASMMNLMQQAAQSGLFGGGQAEGDPAWLKGLREGFGTLQETVGKYLQMKQQEQMMGGVRRTPQPGAPRLPGVPAPQVQRPIHQATQAPERPGTGSGFGQPIQPTRALAPQVAPQPQVPSMPEPMSFVKPIRDFVEAIEQEAPPVDVGDMIYAFADYLRYAGMLPTEWEPVFTQPSETIAAFLLAAAPHVQPKKGYLDEVGIQILEREKEGKDDDDEPEAPEAPPPLRVVEAPTPPAVESAPEA